MTDANGCLAGMVSRANVLDWMRTPPDDTIGGAAGDANPTVAYPDETAAAVADRMVRAGTGRVPVISRQDGRLVGLLARKDLLRVRQRVAAEEQDRERLWGAGQVQAPAVVSPAS